MAELVPHPFARLASRMFRELDATREIFHLPESKLVRGLHGRDLAVLFHGQAAATPLGPAAGPHSQLAQNIVLSFLAGGRIFELKTVQIQDRLQIPRPCIDAQTIGYNVEWSQELTLEQSLEEYVKASMLVDILVASGRLALAPGFERRVFDMSVGYDLAGIQSERVQAFLRGMLDAREVVDRLRAQLPESLREYRDLDFRTCISDTVTLSTFHGCPPDEIERIMSFLLETVGVHAVVKLNPTLLGRDEVRRLLGDVLGYADRPPDDAFARDTTWEQAVGFVGRLREKARALGRGFGVKFSNTLIVENARSFFPASEKVMYLSGQPLHVLAMSLVARFREHFGDAVPISFSAGIDQKNFADAVSLGLVPVTVCTDLLRTGGYGRMAGYLKELGARMDAAGARDIDTFVVAGQGQAEAALVRAGASEAELAACRAALGSRGDLRAAAGPALFARWVSEARQLNTNRYVERLPGDRRYGRAATNKPPRKVGTRLVLFDCLTCDKCIPVCPNDANFTYVLPPARVPVRKGRFDGESWKVREEGVIEMTRKHQIANFADFCNECGNCDVFCPEDGGPYVLKPRFFGSAEQFALHAGRDGFWVERRGAVLSVSGRFAGEDYHVTVEGRRADFRGPGFAVTCTTDDPPDILGGRAEGDVDLTCLLLMTLLARAVLDPGEVSWVSA
jgi:putative selenate reductase